MLFFSLVLFSAPLEPSLAALGLTPLYAAVLVGAAQNIFSKSSKYSLFDPCKEMAYIPLDQETKVRPLWPGPRATRSCCVSADEEGSRRMHCPTPRPRSADQGQGRH